MFGKSKPKPIACPNCGGTTWKPIRPPHGILAPKSGLSLPGFEQIVVQRHACVACDFRQTLRMTPRRDR